MESRLPSAITDVMAKISTTLPGYVHRDAQIRMIQSAWDAFSGNRNVHVIEAPTGTGKSIGYLIPGIVAALAYKKPLIVSTGSVGLQEQIVDKDIPFLAKNSGLSFTYKLVKGRSRYFCERDARNLSLKTHLFKEEGGVSYGKIRQILRDFENGDWNGDIDSLGIPLSPETWEAVANNRNSCTSGKCSHYARCPFFVDRRSLKNYTVLVVNHDFLLADFVHSQKTGRSLLPDLEKSFLVFDEAHHLPAKAVSHNTFTVSLMRSLDVLRKASTTHGVSADLRRSLESFDRIAQEVIQMKLLSDPGARIVRFAAGELPFEFADWIRKEIENPNGILPTLNFLAEKIAEEISEIKDGNDLESQQTLNELSFVYSKTTNALNTWSSFLVETAGNPKARWLSLVETGPGDARRFDIDISVAPLSASSVFQSFWARTSGAVLTSATIRSLGNFNLFAKSTGLTRRPDTQFLSLDSPFDLPKQGSLCIPDMSHDPTSEPHFSVSVARWLKDNLPGKGALVLFTARIQMKAVFSNLPQDLKSAVLLQETGNRSEIISEHARRIRAGERSVLFGVSGLAEGLDLPGDLCVMVVIVRLPFSTPTDPIEESRHEYLKRRGRNAFMELSLPEASFRLVQMAGRLIRTEQDSGTLVILDNRIRTKFYGKILEKNLPPFTVSRVPPRAS